MLTIHWQFGQLLGRPGPRGLAARCAGQRISKKRAPEARGRSSYCTSAPLVDLRLHLHHSEREQQHHLQELLLQNSAPQILSTGLASDFAGVETLIQRARPKPPWLRPECLELSICLSSGCPQVAARSLNIQVGEPRTRPQSLLRCRGYSF